MPKIVIVSVSKLIGHKDTYGMSKFQASISLFYILYLEKEIEKELNGGKAVDTCAPLVF